MGGRIITFFVFSIASRSSVLMLLLDNMGMVVLDDVSCLHGDGGAG